MTAGLYYVSEAYSIDGPKLMGRNAAGESFLRGFLAHSRTSDAFWLQVENEQDAKHFASRATAFGRIEQIKAFSAASLGDAKKPGVIYHPGPGIAKHADLRRGFGDASWSLCGITHTTSSASAMDALSGLLISPVQPWDALICTSSAVKQNVENVLQAQADYLRDRLGTTRIVLPELPVIPLGIHTSDFEYTATQRQNARSELAINEHSIVVLYTGRLSFHAKAHPLVMYQALEAAATATGKHVTLIECGWFANDFIKDAFTDAAGHACPSVRVIRLDGRESSNRNLAWSSADIFCSLSDNIQETFGIVPIEAMAAGLPVIVSDWNGYKDSVRDGVDGYRIRSIGPKPGLGGDLAHRHALGIDTYDRYCGFSSSLIGIHFKELVASFERLLVSPELRHTMGRAGKLRAAQVYDWGAIMPLYEELWDSQHDIRKSAAKKSARASRTFPARLDPTKSFSHYPTTLLTPDTILRMTRKTASEAMADLAELRTLAMVSFADYVFPTDQEIYKIFEQAGKDGAKASASSLIEVIEEQRRPFALRGLTWLVKLGLFTFE